MTREEAIKILEEEAEFLYGGDEPYNKTAFDMAIEALQQEPVKHGKWKYYNYSDINNPYVGWYECSVCKQYEHIEYKFCPNCGAKMDKE